MTIKNLMNRREAISIAVAVILFLVSLSIGLTFRHYYWDDPYIISVYARNLIQGNGLVFNPGERILGTTTPLYTLLLALTGLFYSNLPTTSCVLGALCTALLGVFLFFGTSQGRDWLAGSVCASLVILSANSYTYVGIETYFYAMLVYGSFSLFCRSRYGSSAALAALAVLARPDGILAAILLIMAYCIKEKTFPSRYFTIFLAITLPWALFAICYYGNVIPQTFYAKKGSLSSWQYFNEYVVRGIGESIYSRSQQNLPFSPLILPSIGLISGAWRSPFLRLSYIYSVAMIIGYVIIASEDPWHSYPVMVAAFLSIGYSIIQVSRWIGAIFKSRIPRNCARTITVILLAVPILLRQFSDLEQIRDGYARSWLGGSRHKAYLLSAEWLNANASPGSSVLTLEPGTIAFYSNCIFYDYWGLISRKGWNVSWRDVPRRLKPDYIIWSNFEEEDAHPVPAGYILRNVIKVDPYPALFISENSNPEKKL